MIKIEKNLYDKLVKITEHEQCGFVVGNNNILREYYKVKNIARNEDRFEMGFISKLISLIRIYLGKYKFICIYHVHANSNYLSLIDFEHAVNNMVYLIICNNRLNFYKIKKKLINRPFLISYEII